MTKSNCIMTCEINMAEYARLFTYEALSEDTCAVTGYTGSEPVSLLIPAADPDGRTVVAIGDRAFANRASLRAVTLPDTVDRYRIQVQTYGEALSRIFEKPIKAQYLYFFQLNQFVEV